MQEKGGEHLDAQKKPLPRFEDLSDWLLMLSLKEFKSSTFRREVKAAEKALEKVRMLRKKGRPKRIRKNAEKLITKLLFETEKHLVKAEALGQRQKVEFAREIESFKTGKYKNPKKTAEKDSHPESVDWAEVDIIWHTKDKQLKSWYVDKKDGAGTFLRKRDDIKLFGFDSLKDSLRFEKVVQIISQIANMSNPSYESFKVIADKYSDDFVYGHEGALNLILAMQRHFPKKEKSDSFGRIDIFLVKDQR
ncbi:hypothetical protein HZA40_00710 [Candidatus Peregrinibacteria bacterium]|nr:hypothetical protein [Candidatus Peregrinibacteria bacterium]